VISATDSVSTPFSAISVAAVSMMAFGDYRGGRLCGDALVFFKWGRSID